MKLSIIVPVYNMAADNKLAFCLDSLISQTISDYEIIAVDDASTDGSADILRDYATRYPERFIAVFSPENLRQGGAKNIGLSKARGEWIGFIDSDDWIAPDFYERLIAEGEATGADIVGCDYAFTDTHSYEPGRRVATNSAGQAGELDEKKYRLLILDGGSLVVKVYRRHIIFDYPNRFPEGIFYEDNAIGPSWFLRAKRFAYIPEPLYFYYQHGGSTVHTITEERCQDRMEAARIMIAEAKEFGYYDAYMPELEYKFTQTYYVNTLFSYMRMKGRHRPEFVQAMNEEMREYFPDFQENQHYQTRHTEEEKKLVAMAQKAPLRFMLYFKLLWFWRDKIRSC